MEALALDLEGRLADRAIVKVHIAAFSALKTFDPPLSALEGTLVEDVTRHGKFLDIRPSRAAPRAAPGPRRLGPLARRGAARSRRKPSNKSPLAARARRRSTTQSGLDITEAGTRKSLAMYVVRAPARRARHRLASGRTRSTTTSPSSVLARDPRARGPHAAQGRAAPPGHDRRHRQRLLRRAPARRADVAVQAGQQPRPTTSWPRCTPRSATSSATRSTAPAAWPPASSRARRSPTWPCTAAPASRARSAATPSARSRSPTRACSTARPARPAASRWPTAGCPKLLK